eukprot:TRINITY_DN5241_c0_g1_i1.p1 TRINITY_DN5241_c0_g1~~TRINITY_DN5241_c0_g1_i1.p1  ORF type:complete len:383 (-),score=39.19 TRINITY_DN5241_c0_g1_i1:34-1182(-)
MTRIYTWGLGKNYQLGSKNKNNEACPYLVPLPGKLKSATVVQVACGAHSTFALTDCGQLWALGCGKHFRLGLEHDDDVQEFAQIPLPEMKNEKLVSVSIAWHGIGLTDKGRVLTWGHRGGLGRSGGHSPDFVEILNETGQPEEIKSISAGHQFSLAASASGVLYSWGVAHDGCLGRGGQADKPKEVAVPGHVIGVSAGYAHAACWTADGLAYAWGRSECGALGVEKQKAMMASKTTGGRMIEQPVEMKLPEGIVVCEAGCSKGQVHHHTTLRTSDGLYAAGDGYKDKLGLDTTDLVFTPGKLQTPVGNHQQLAIGGIHSALLAEDTAWTWGCGSDGRMGHPESVNFRYLFKEKSPRKVEGIVGKVISLSSSYYHMAAAAEDK